VIDWLFEVSRKTKIEDYFVMFEAISLMDRFYYQAGLTNVT